MENSKVEMSIFERYGRFAACYVVYMCLIALPLGIAVGSIKLENWNIEQLCISTVLIYICTQIFKFFLFSEEQRNTEIADCELRQACLLAIFSYIITFGGYVILAESYAAVPLALYMSLLIICRYMWFTEFDLQKLIYELWGTEDSLFKRKRNYIISIPMILVLLYNLLLS